MLIVAFVCADIIKGVSSPAIVNDNDPISGTVLSQKYPIPQEPSRQLVKHSFWIVGHRLLWIMLMMLFLFLHIDWDRCWTVAPKRTDRYFGVQTTWWKFVSILKHQLFHLWEHFSKYEILEKKRTRGKMGFLETKMGKFCIFLCTLPAHRRWGGCIVQWKVTVLLYRCLSPI